MGVLDAWSWAREAEDVEYDVITCLNLLDRCDTPRSLLTQIHSRLAPSGTLVVALVLPFSPYVETGTMDNLPSEDMRVRGSTLEAQVNVLADEVFPSLGFSLVRWSRLPYLCEGDLDQAFYWLSDVVFILRKVKDDASQDETEVYGDKKQEKEFIGEEREVGREVDGVATYEESDDDCYEDALYEIKTDL
ncbi:hypothetical protein Pcinc_029822 [Petrolisthes cinctipes]|uniref:Methyltransferase-like protein 9 n=1 Tax=Petrolisthes cinctipes TaxID=88211 RepID=A0AAE1F0I6_PETCI|nr:hypothetical protein Pcinc_029822 [Petrolisthes cinctipes]